MSIAVVDEEIPEPTLDNVVSRETLRWVFVGGKGGVGKTTTSCSLAIALAAKRERVLLVSTDPAHNLSDAFRQKFGPKPTLVDGFDNLFCMESESEGSSQFQQMMQAEGAPSELLSSDLVKDVLKALPMDEALVFSTLWKRLKAGEFSCVVFDTAPTGHTLKLLELPDTLRRLMLHFRGLQSRFGGILRMATSMLNGAGDGSAGPLGAINLEELEQTVSSGIRHTEEIMAEFRDKTRTTFVCVCIPEFLSVYETERLVQELGKNGIEVRNIVVNQLIFEDAQSTACGWCTARRKIQTKYIDQLYDLYDTRSIVEMPMMTTEVRGTEALNNFSHFLLHPYVDTLPPMDGDAER